MSATWHPLSVATINTWVGNTIRKGVLEELAEIDPDWESVDLIFFQEVRDVAELRRALGDEWEVAPDRARFKTNLKRKLKTRRRPALPYVAYRKSAFRSLRRPEQHNITFKSRYFRTMPVATLRHEATGRRVVAISVHLENGKGPKGREARRLQGQRIAQRVRRSANAAAVLLGGDFNEPLGKLNGPAGSRLAGSGLRLASHVLRQGVHIDDVGHREDAHVRAVGRRVHRPVAQREKNGKAGHPVVVVDYEIRSA